MTYITRETGTSHKHSSLWGKGLDHSPATRIKRSILHHIFDPLGIDDSTYTQGFKISGSQALFQRSIGQPVKASQASSFKVDLS